MIACSCSRSATTPTSGAASRRASSPVAAALRMCISSPMARACDIRLARSIGPSRSRTAWNAGATTSRIHARPASVSGPYAPNLSWCPQGPSAMKVQALVRFTGSSITSKGVPGEMTPAMGPTAPWA